MWQFKWRQVTQATDKQGDIDSVVLSHFYTYARTLTAFINLFYCPVHYSAFITLKFEEGKNL